MNTLWQALRGRMHPGSQTLWLGLMAVVLFAMTLPMTRLANGSLTDPQWPPLFVASARAAIAGVLAACHLVVVRAARPSRQQWPWLLAIAVGGVMGFPLGMGWAVRIVPASHAALITGLLPLCTASLAAWWLGHRPRRGFWAVSVAGAVVMALYAGWSASAWGASGGGQAACADGALVLGMVGASVAYVAGARLAREMPSLQVMSWALLLAWPVTASLSAQWWPAEFHTLGTAWDRIRPDAWIGLLYVSVCSTWLGFLLWYTALARDAMRVSQLQLLQPLMAMVASAVLLDEAVPLSMWLFALLVMAMVLAAQRLASPPAPLASSRTVST